MGFKTEREQSVKYTLYLVRINGEYSYINSQGKIVIRGPFAAADLFSEGRAVVMENGACGYINKKGEIVVDPAYFHTYCFMDGLALIIDGIKMGYINRQGEFIWELQK